MNSRKQKEAAPCVTSTQDSREWEKIWLLSFPPSIIAHHRLEWRDFFENL